MKEIFLPETGQVIRYRYHTLASSNILVIYRNSFEETKRWRDLTRLDERYRHRPSILRLPDHLYLYSFGMANIFQSSIIVVTKIASHPTQCDFGCRQRPEPCSSGQCRLLSYLLAAPKGSQIDGRCSVWDLENFVHFENRRTSQQHNIWDIQCTWWIGAKKSWRTKYPHGPNPAEFNSAH